MRKNLAYLKVVIFVFNLRPIENRGKNYQAWLFIFLLAFLAGWPGFFLTLGLLIGLIASMAFGKTISRKLRLLFVYLDNFYKKS